MHASNPNGEPVQCLLMVHLGGAPPAKSDQGELEVLGLRFLIIYVDSTKSYIYIYLHLCYSL